VNNIDKLIHIVSQDVSALADETSVIGAYEHFKHRSREPRPCYCLKDGKKVEFDSIRLLAESIDVTPTSINRAINRKGKTKGYIVGLITQRGAS